MNTYNVTFVMDYMTITTHVVASNDRDEWEIINMANSALAEQYNFEPLMNRHNDVTVSAA